MTVIETKEIIERLKLDYGSTITEEQLVESFKIELPDLSGSAREIVANAKKFELDKMNSYLMINEQLLNIGKCLVQNKDIYRVPLISEISNQINKYYNSSNRKFKRAEKLRKSFSNLHPAEATETNNRANRAITMRSGIDKVYSPMI